jgi:hypothetical protein
MQLLEVFDYKQAELDWMLEMAEKIEQEEKDYQEYL